MAVTHLAVTHLLHRCARLLQSGINICAGALGACPPPASLVRFACAGPPQVFAPIAAPDCPCLGIACAGADACRPPQPRRGIRASENRGRVQGRRSARIRDRLPADLLVGIMPQWLGRRHGKTGSHLEGRRVNTAWETLQAGRRRSKRRMSTATWKTPRHTSSSSSRGSQPSRSPRPNAWPRPAAGPSPRPVARPTAPAPPPPAHRFPERRWRSSGTSAMGIEFRFENRQGSPMIVGTGGPCATSDLGLYRVEAVPSSLMAREKAEDPYSWKRRDSRSSAKRRQACRSTTSGTNSRPATSRRSRAAAANQSTPEAKKNYQQMQCVARNHVQYEQAIYGWFKANWKSCLRCQAASGFTCRATCGSRDSAGPSRPGHVAHSRDARRDRLKRAEPAAPRPPDRPSRRTCPPRTPRPGCHSAVRIIGAAHVAAVGIEQRDDPCELARHQLPDLQGRARAWAEFV